MLKRRGSYVFAGRLDEIPLRGGKSIRLGVDEIALFRVGDDVVAVTNVCPHQHFSKLHEGETENGRVTCPMHGWTFDLSSGMALVGSGRLTKHRVLVKNDEVWVEWGDGE